MNKGIPYHAVLIAITALLLAACQQAPEPPTTAPRYSAEAFYQTTSYLLSRAPAWSADGSKLLIASDETGTFNIYALNGNGTEKSALTTSSETAQRPISWFPNDDRMLFSSDDGGNELHHVYVREVSGETADLTPGDELKASFLAWSGDKQYFFLLSNERSHESFDLYRYSTKDYAREMVLQNNEAWQIASVSRDGRYLALRREHSSANSDLFLLDLQATPPTPVLITAHEDDVQHTVFEFTPDSKALVYGTDQYGEFTQAWIHTIASGEKHSLVQAEWDVVFLFYSASGRYRVVGINEDARMAIQVLDTETNSIISLPELPSGQLAQVRFSPDDQRIALIVSSDTSPRDIYVVNLKAGSSQRLTTALSPHIDESALVTSATIRYPSFDGLEIPGILYKPRQASAQNPVPALVWVHGGPGGQSRTGYSAMIQHLVNHGYAVLAANNRGSSGYGKTFFHMDDKQHGEVDLDDIVYAEHYLASLDWVDKDQIGIIGRSYGGYMVVAALAFRADVFKVGVNIFGVMNWVRTLESIPPYWEAIRKRLYDELGDPAVDGERLRRISPLFHADNIRTPLLVIQGANDPRVLQVESDEIVAAVKANDVVVEYLVFEDEGHGFSQKANRIVASDTFVRFLDQYLKGITP